MLLTWATVLRSLFSRSRIAGCAFRRRARHKLRRRRGTAGHSWFGVPAEVCEPRILLASASPLFAAAATTAAAASALIASPAHEPSSNAQALVYTVAGTSNQTVTISFTLTHKDPPFDDEFGLILVDDASARIGKLMPDDPGYARAAFAPSRLHTIFARGTTAGATATITLAGGSRYILYGILNASSQTHVAQNPDDRIFLPAPAFFSVPEANPDFDTVHFRASSSGQINFEDLPFAIDHDFSDLVVNFQQGPPQGGSKPAVADRLADDTGVSSTDRITFDPTVQGTVTGSSPIAALEAAFDLGTTPVFKDVTTKLVNGSFVLTRADLAAVLGSPLVDGSYRLLVRARDSTGQLSDTTALNFTLDTTIAAPTVALANDTGVSATDGITSDPTVQGTASDADGVVTLQAAFDTGTGTPIFHDITAKLVNGTFRLTATDLTSVLGAPLVDGTYTLLVHDSDTAGNDSANAVSNFTLDTTIAAPTVALTNDTGISATDGITADPTVQGTASDADGVVALQAAFDTGTGPPVFQDITAKLVNGTFTLTAANLAGVLGAPLADGTYKVLVHDSDTAGNVSANAELNFTLDTTIAAPTVALANDTGISATDGITADPTVQGTASDADGVVTLQASFDTGAGTPIFHDITAKLVNGTFRLTATDLTSVLGAPLVDGTYMLLVHDSDTAGNVSANAVLSFTLDTTVAAPAAALVNDSGTSNTDRITNDPTLNGTAVDPNGIAKLEAALDAGLGSPLFVDITSKVANGQYALGSADLAGILGGPLVDGSYRFSVRNTDVAGNVSAATTLLFTLDTTPPVAPVFDLDPNSDTAPAGDGQTTLHVVTLIGQTEPGAAVSLVPSGATTSADPGGNFSFSGVPLVSGANDFTATATDLAGNQSTFSRSITQIDACGFENGLADWNVSQFGGSQAGQGTVTVAPGANGDNAATLHEGDSFLVTLRQTFTIPDAPSVLNITYDNLAFDRTDPSSVNDAFEMALVDSQGNSLVHTFTSGADAFFNVTEDLPPALGAEASLSGTTVSLDVSGLAAGSSATLILRLVNDDTDTGSQVTISCVQFSPLTQVAPAAPTTIQPFALSAPQNASAAAASVAPNTQPVVVLQGQTAPAAPATATLTDRPLVFEPNVGQSDSQVEFLTRGSGFTAQFTGGEAVLTLAGAGPGTSAPGSGLDFQSSIVEMQLAGAGPNATIEGLDPLTSTSNYFIGNSPQDWLKNVPNFGKIEYHDVYSGIDLVYYGNQQKLEYDFVVAPGADPTQIGLDFTGGDLSLDTAGDLVVHTAAGDLIEHAPVVYQTIGGQRVSVEGAYEIAGQRVTIRLGAYDPTQPVFIDPILAYSSYFGGSHQEQAFGISPDGNGNVFITGDTSSLDLPIKDAIQPTAPGGSVSNIGSDIYLAKFGPDGSLLFSTYFGGTSGDAPVGVAVDRAGNPIIAAHTNSSDFPTRNAIQSQFGGGFEDAAVVKFLADGSDFLFSTYLGGPGQDDALNMAIDSAANVYVTGSADPGFPTVNAIHPTAAGGTTDAFVSELNASGTALVYSTYLGGSNGQDVGDAIAVDDQGAAYIAGETTSPDFPTRGAFQSSYGGGGADGFVAKIAPGGSSLVYSRFLGGSAADRGLAIAVDAQRNAYVTGYTLSADFPTKNAFQPTFGGGTVFGDAFVTKINPGGNDIVYSTYVGDQGENGSKSIQVDASGSVYFAGSGDMRNRANASGLDFQYGGPTSSFIGQLDATGQNLVRAVYIGGQTGAGGVDYVTLGPPGVVYFTGRTTSTDFPTVNAFQEQNAGGYDAVFGKLILETPSIAIESPADESQFAVGTKLLVSGTSSGPVLVNGKPVDATDAAGDFFTEVTVAPGQNTFTFTTTDQFEQTATATLTLTGTEQPAGKVDFSQFSDVSGSVSGVFARTSFNERTNMLMTDTAVRNAGQYVADAPLLVVVDHLSLPSVFVRGQTGVTPDGTPFFDFSSQVAGGSLSPADTTAAQTISFFDPARSQFQFGLDLLGKVNQLPAFTTIPRLEAIVGHTYSYTAAASDSDGDPLTFSLLAGPSSMTVDATTGVVAWAPTSSDVGTQVVTLQVADGRGGFAQQRFILSVEASMPNRPPVITSVPVVSANVNRAYAYQVTATDADGDALAYSLTSPPAGMQIDAGTGLITWTPTGDEVGTQQVSVLVDDSHSGQAVQNYAVATSPVPGNHAPIIISTPVTQAIVDQPYQYSVVAIDPDNDPLTYSLTQAPAGMAIDPASGQINWHATNTVGGDPNQPAVTVRTSDGRGGSDTQTFNIDVQPNTPPKIISQPVTDAFVGTSYTYAVKAVDPDGDPLTYSLTDSTAGTTINSTSGVITWPNPQPGVQFGFANQIGGASGDGVNKIASDDLGNVYVNGSITGVVDFDPGPGVENLGFANTTTAFVAKYSRDGALVWVRGINDATAGTLAVGADGEVWASGAFSGTADFDPGPGSTLLTATASDIFLWKLDTNGNFLWAHDFGPSLNVPGLVHQNMAVGSDGTLIVVGGFTGTADFDPGTGVQSLTANGPDAAYILKLDRNGEFQWVRQIGDPSGGINLEGGRNLTIDNSGNVVIAGAYYGTVDMDPGPGQLLFNSTMPLSNAANGRGGGFTLKLDAAGNFVWARDFHLLSGSISAEGVAVDQSGNVYVGSDQFEGTFNLGPGTSTYTSRNGSHDAFLFKFDGTGDVIWGDQFGGNDEDLGHDVSVDELGNVYFTGTFTGTVNFDPGGGTDLLSSTGHSEFLVKITPDNHLVWAIATANAERSMNVDCLGDVLIGGFFAGSTEDFDPGAGTTSLTSNGQSDGFFAQYRQAGALVQVSDGHGGTDTQCFSIDVHTFAPAQIQGSVFDDANGDATRERGQLLVASYNTSSVLRYDGATGASLGDFISPNSGGIQNPGGLVFAPNGDLLVATSTSAEVARFDGTTGAFLEEFVQPGTTQFAYLTFGPDGNLYVSDYAAHVVDRFDGKTGALIGAFATGAMNPQGVVFGPDGNLYVADEHDVLKYDGKTGAFLSVFVADGSGGLITPVGIAFGPDGNLYVSGNRSHDVLRYDGTTGAFLGAFVPVNSGGLQRPHGLIFGPDGDLYVADESSQVLQYDGKTGAFIRAFVPSGSGGLNSATALLFTPDAEQGLAGRTVFLDANGNGQLDPGERSTTTDAFGNYSFTGLVAGSYTVAEQVPSGWIETSPGGGVYQETLTAGQVVSGLDFGNQQSATPPPPANQPPQFTSTAPTTAIVGQLFRYDAVATDSDGDPLTFDLPVKPVGMAVDPKSGTLVWVPTADEIGPQSVVLRVSDGQGGVDLQAFSLQVGRANSIPVITSTPKGPAVVGTPWQYQVTAQDADGDTLAFSLGAHPDGMTINSITGLVQWTATAAQVGSQNVEITADDGHGAATTQSFALPVSATAPDNPPAITSNPRGSIRLGDQYAYQVVASDPDGDPLAFSVPIAPAGMTIDANGLLSWTPTAAQFGANSVRLQVADGRGGFAVQSWTVNVVSQTSDQPPNITSNPPGAATVGRLYAYDVKATDPDGDPLAYSLDTAPAGMSVDSKLGTIRWTPTADETGPQSVALRVVDGLGGYATQTFTIAVRALDLPPNITSSPPTTAVANKDYSYALQAVDPEGDALAFTLTSAPTGMTIDSQTGLVDWTPTSAQIGPASVSALVDDGQGGTAIQTWTVVVSATANRPPVITSTPSLAATVAAPYTYQVTAADPDGDPLLFSLLANPGGMTIDPTSGLLQWTPTADEIGVQSVTVAAIDPSGAGGTQTFQVAVADNNQNPAITSQPSQTVTAGLPYRYDLQFGDPDGDPLTLSLDQAPAGMALDQLGRLTWAPQIADIGTHSIAITVADNRGGSITQTFDLAVLADTQTPLVNLVINPNPAALGSPVVFAVSATDNVAVTSLGLTINGVAVPLDANGRAAFIAQPAGQYDIVASASDAAGNTGLATTTLPVIDTSDVNAPTVDIASPDGTAPISSPVDVVGTASDANLVSYSVSVAPLGSDQFTQMFSGTQSVTNGVLGKFDPTGLANGAYTLRLSATDTGGNTSFIDETIDVAGDLKVGNFTLSFTDLSIPVAGIPITVSRTYDSLNAGQSQDFGFGWRLEFRDTNLTTNVPSSGEEDLGVYNAFRAGTRVYITLPGGKREGFTFEPTLVSGFGGLFGIYSPQFVPDPNVTDHLAVPDIALRHTDTGDYYAIVNGGTLNFNPADALNFGGEYTLTTKDGVEYTINAVSGQLDNISDTYGNALSFSDTAITSNHGQQVTFERDPQGRITAAVDPSGNKVQYAYDAKGDLVSVTDRDGNVTQFVYDDPSRAHFLTKVIDPLGRTGVRTDYDAEGRLLRLVDAQGNPVAFAYDPDHSLETITDALGHSTTYEYDQFGNVVHTIDALGHETFSTYGDFSTLLSQTNELGEMTTYTYDAFGEPLTTTDPLGNVTLNTYTVFHPSLFDIVRGAQLVDQLASTTDPLGNATHNDYVGGNLVQTTDAAGNATSFTYDAAGNQTSITNSAGNTTHFTYDGAGHLISQVDALGNETDYTYDANGNQISQTTTVTGPGGPRKVTTTTQYDANGNAIAVTDAEGNTTHTQYDALGHQVAVIDARGNTTQFVYDARGELVETIFPDATPNDPTDNPRTTTEYDAAGHVVARTDEAGRRTQYVYDALGRLIETILPDNTPGDDTDNPTTKTEYDAAGRVSAQVDELGNRTQFFYDADGRQIDVRDALGNDTKTQYDAAGRVIATTDALGHTTQFVLDALGRTTETIYADGSTTFTGYDALGRVVSQTDQLGRVTRDEYDALGRLTAVVDALNQRTTYAYDEAGNLVTQTDANGHATHYEYDLLGRKTATVLPLGQRSTTTYDANGNVASTTDFDGQTITFQYDAQNRLISKNYPDGTSVTYTYTPTGQIATETDSRGVTQFAYDARDRLLSRTDPDGTTISYTYDAAGNRTSVTTPAGTTSFTFDADNRTSTVTDPDGAVTHYTYDATGNLTLTQFASGTTETRGYDALNRLVSIVDTTSSGVIASFQYTLAATGRRDEVTELGGRTDTYGYDALDRLTSETIVDPANGNRTITFTYDAVGNRLSQNDSAQGTTVSTYDANDRLLTETLGGQTTMYTYDNNGDTLTKSGPAGTTIYHWDFDQRLAGVDINGDGTVDVVNEYNPEGLRVAQIVSGQETRFLIDTVQPFGQVLLEYTPGGVIQASYVYGNALISQTRGGTKSFYLADGLGSTRLLTDASGSITDRYIYDAFGRTLFQSGTTINLYQFAAQQRDPNVGLDYLRARYLNVGSGRFFGMDPAGMTPGTSSPEAGFIYAADDPVNTTDPSGMWPPGIHRRIIQGAFWNILKRWEIDVLIDTSERQDNVFGQNPWLSYEHAMRNGLTFQSVADARNQYQNFLDSNLKQARVLQLSTSFSARLGFLRLLGENIHAVSDSTSPAHQGFQPWNPFDLPAVLLHKALEWSISPQQFSSTIMLVQREYLRFVTTRGIEGRSVTEIVPILVNGLRDFEAGLRLLSSGA